MLGGPCAGKERSERTAVVGCVGCLSRDCLGEEGCESEACDGRQHDHLRKQRREGGGREAGRGQEERERDGWLRHPLTSARRVPVFRPWTLPSATLNTIPSSLAAPDAQARTRPTGYHPSQYTALALLIRTCADTPAPPSGSLAPLVVTQLTRPRLTSSTSASTRLSSRSTCRKCRPSSSSPSLSTTGKSLQRRSTSTFGSSFQPRRSTPRLTAHPLPRPSRLAALTRGGGYKLDSYGMVVGPNVGGGVGDNVVSCVRALPRASLPLSPTRVIC